MTDRYFSTEVEFKAMIEPLIEKAISKTCDRLLGTLQELIMSEFYDSYDNTRYQRSYQFYRSAMTKMLSQTLGMIFMDADAMDYPFAENQFGWAWSGEQQLEAANEGVHGGWSTDESRQHRYWEEFEKYCDKNAINILKSELINLGLNIVG